MGSRTVIYSFVMGMLNSSIQSGYGPAGSRTVVYNLIMGMLVAENYYKVW